MNPYFIIGTDTDCGKTYVTVRLMEYLSERSKKVKALKPVASGCYLQDGQLINDDCVSLKSFDSSNDLAQDLCPWALRLPIAPHLAAKHDDVSLSAKNIASFCTRSSLKAYDVVLIEGAGGLLVPLNDNETWVDVIKAVKIPVILVVGMRLGCINHALLTVSALNMHEIPCLGWVANCVDENMLYMEQNISTLKARIDAPLLGIVEHGQKIKILDEDIFKLD
jgi:dethiobiotin synthetase